MAGKEEMMRKIKAGNFRENNGRVLRTINIMIEKYVPLRSIKYALTDLSENEIIKSINFLQEEEYIRLRNIESKQEVMLSDVDYIELEAKLTGKGIRLLDGDISDNVVDV